LNKIILNTGVQNFIKNNWNTDIVSVLLKKPLFEGITQRELAEQLESKKKCKDKLPTWFHTEQIYYPNKLNIEQTSSEISGKYKAGLVNGKSLIDLTGGFGVDSFFFSKKFDEVTHCEIDENLSKMAAHNAQLLGSKNSIFKTGNGVDFIRGSNSKFDWVYVDPSRRNDSKEKVFLLKDCEPNVPKFLDDLFQKTTNILIKTSPLLDIKQGLKELTFVREVHVVAVKNEVKELLWLLEKGFDEEVTIKTINLKTDHTETFDFQLPDESYAISIPEYPQTYLYEPNAAILKAGAFKILSQRLAIGKLHPHSHLYTSQKLVPYFPGRSFEIVKTVPVGKKELKKLGISKANVTVRNFPERVDSIRKIYKIKEGGKEYLFFTTDKSNKKIAIHCVKV